MPHVVDHHIVDRSRRASGRTKSAKSSRSKKDTETGSKSRKAKAVRKVPYTNAKKRPEGTSSKNKKAQPKPSSRASLPHASSSQFKGISTEDLNRQITNFKGELADTDERLQRLENKITNSYGDIYMKDEEVDDIMRNIFQS